MRSVKEHILAHRWSIIFNFQPNVYVNSPLGKQNENFWHFTVTKIRFCFNIGYKHFKHYVFFPSTFILPGLFMTCSNVRIINDWLQHKVRELFPAVIIFEVSPVPDGWSMSHRKYKEHREVCLTITGNIWRSFKILCDSQLSWPSLLFSFASIQFNSRIQTIDLDLFFGVTTRKVSNLWEQRPLLCPSSQSSPVTVCDQLYSALVFLHEASLK